MIRLKPVPKPAKLTRTVQDKLTDQFKKDNKKRVWAKSYIKKALLDMSHKKCCYCECYIAVESKYLEVEHYYPKSIHRDKVVEWENLLPSCKRCNRKKGEHDTVVEPIIHPVKNEPKEHLGFKLFQILAKKTSQIGGRTVHLLKLNDYKRLEPRYKICVELEQKLDDLNSLFEEYSRDFTPDKKKRIYKRLEGYLRQGTPPSDYSAVAATVILNNPHYQKIKEGLEKIGIWDNGLQTLEDEVKTCALDML